MIGDELTTFVGCRCEGWTIREHNYDGYSDAGSQSKQAELLSVGFGPAQGCAART
ncbi:MAG: hypothetical protein WD275_08770 [Rhodothermales bacterium]